MRHFHGLSGVLLQASFLLGAIGVAACAATGSGNTFTGSGGHGGAGANGTGGDDTIITTGAGNSGTTDTGTLTAAPPCNVTDQNADMDGDGFSPAHGDCNDCTPQMNPGAFDWPGNGVDEDCNGKADDTPTECDGSLAIDSSDAKDGARAIGLCTMQNGASWGLISARYAAADNSPLSASAGAIGHGILPDFGTSVKPRQGKKLLALSSGAARAKGDPGFYPVGNENGFVMGTGDTGLDKGYSGNPPPGFPKDSPACPSAEPAVGAFDSIALEVKVKVPTNAKSLSFNLDFYTSEYPAYICSPFNDFFVALLSPPPDKYPDGNISFDAKGNLISVNAGFLQVCAAGNYGGKNFDCPLGTSQLKGSGFDVDAFDSPSGAGAATSWLETSSPVQPGSTITLRFAIWDSTDPNLDSTVLIDNFTWGTAGGETVTTPVPVQ